MPSRLPRMVWKILSLFIFLTQFSSISCITCYYQTNVTANYWYPDQNLQPVQYQADTNNYCMWEFFIPDGSYVNLTLYGVTRGNDLYYVEYFYTNKTFELEAADQLVDGEPRTYYMPAGNNYLFLFCSQLGGICQNSTIAFSAIYNQLPNVQPTRSFTTGPNMPSIVLTDEDVYNTPVVVNLQNDSTICLHIAAKSNNNNTYSYNGYMIYNGSSTMGVPLGSVFPWQFMFQISYSTQITIIKIDNSIPTALLISSNKNMANFGSLTTFIWHTQKQATYSITGFQFQPSALIVYSPMSESEYITDIQFAGNSTIVSVFAGTPTANYNNMLGQYRMTTYRDYLPQKISGSLRTFIVENGHANIMTAYNDTNVIKAFYTPRPGRKCFLSSDNYLFDSIRNEAHTFMDTDNHTHYGFFINTEYTYFENNGGLRETVMQHDNNISRVVNTTHQIENGAFFAEGDGLILNYVESSSKKSGFYVTIAFFDGSSQTTRNPTTAFFNESSQSTRDPIDSSTKFNKKPQHNLLLLLFVVLLSYRVVA